MVRTQSKRDESTVFRRIRFIPSAREKRFEM